MSGELGAGISAGWIASAAPSSTRRVRRVKTERMRKAMRRTLRIRKIVRPRRMVVVEAVVGRMAGMREKGGRSGIGGGRQRVAQG